MKALTVKQPWAYLIVTGHKKIETRSWHTAYRGDLAIHASMTLSPAGAMLVDDLRLAPANGYEVGQVLGVVELVDCVRIDRRFALALERDEEALGNYEPGRWAWMLERPRTLRTPVAARGQLGLWEIDL